MKGLRVLLIALAGALLVDPPEGNGCGPFLPTAQFQFVNNPGPDFAQGKLGVLLPTYRRFYLVVAYRYLTGAPLGAGESAVPRWEAAVQEPPPPNWIRWTDSLAGRRWIEARHNIPGVPDVVSMESYRQTMTNGVYLSYQNCLDDAFDTAAQTLAARVARWGPRDARTAEWVRGQDQVFANCAGSSSVPWVHKVPAVTIPAALPANADPLLAADRQYQIAAAALYAGDFKDAEADFRAVAANSASPWRSYGAYLAARALIREGTVNNDPPALAEAERELRGVVNDPQQARLRKSAQGLLDFLAVYLHPDDRLVELGDELSKPGLGQGFQQALTDYTSLWDSMGRRARKFPTERSDLTDWIKSFQIANEPHTLERWRAVHGAAWLVAALASASGGDQAAPELIDAARKVPPGSPAYATAAFHGIRLLAERHEDEGARAWAERVLAANLPPDAKNAIQVERRKLARNWLDFLRYAPMRPVAENDDIADDPIASREDLDSQGPLIDAGTAAILNSATPLDLWRNAARNPLLPRRLQAEVARTGWVRAVILGRPAAARDFARRVTDLQPDLAEGMRAYQAADSPAAAKFAAVLMMLRAPGLAPTLRWGFGRYVAAGKRDDLRDNWWWLKDSAPGVFVSFGMWIRPKTPAEAGFLSAAQQEQGKAEWAALAAAAGSGVDYLCAATLNWARSHPDDPRVPEALHLAVDATHFGQPYGAKSAYSQKVFQLLHRRYPNTEWARMTKYWY